MRADIVPLEEVMHELPDTRRAKRSVLQDQSTIGYLLENPAPRADDFVGDLVLRRQTTEGNGSAGQRWRVQHRGHGISHFESQVTARHAYNLLAIRSEEDTSELQSLRH